jgi:hypothetical protein
MYKNVMAWMAKTPQADLLLPLIGLPAAWLYPEHVNSICLAWGLFTLYILFTRAMHTLAKRLDDTASRIENRVEAIERAAQMLVANGEHINARMDSIELRQLRERTHDQLDQPLN